MKKLLTVPALLVLAALVVPVPAQDSRRLYSVPALPPQEALDRLRLQTAWTATVPTDGRRDGLYSVQLAPRSSGMDVLVQTRSGGVTALDGTTGRTRWTTRVGTSYQVAQALAYNRDAVFVVNSVELYALDRATGRLQWKYDLPSGVAAPPAADDDQAYVSLTNGRFIIYGLPNMVLWEKLARDDKHPGGTMLDAARARKGIDTPAIGPLSGARESYRVPQGGPQPTERYSYVPEDKVELTPVLSQDRVLLPGAGGRIVGVAKAAKKEVWSSTNVRGRLVVPIGQHDETAYVAGSDYNVYAINVSGGQLLWRFAAGGKPTDRPAVLDDEIYLPVERAGLLRIDRGGGQETWRNEDARRFLAASKNFVYAADRQGRLLVLDRARGTTLSTYDGTRDFVFPIQNDWTDRVLLAANNGLIVCLHDRDQDRPLVMKTWKDRTLLAPPGGHKLIPSGDGGKPMGPPDGDKPKPPPDGDKPKPPPDGDKP